jgi:hypothetical protein
VVERFGLISSHHEWVSQESRKNGLRRGTGGKQLPGIEFRWALKFSAVYYIIQNYTL